MRRTRRPFIPQRRPIFVGCEGASEASYAAVLQDLVRAAGLPIHLIVKELGPGAGDPLDRVQMAIRELDRHTRTRGAIADRFVLLDTDQTAAEPQRAERARHIAQKNKIEIVWQDPCFEALLLRHLDGFVAHRPVNTLTAERALARAWPGYAKPMSRINLSRRIDLSAVLRAARVEADLHAMIQCLGLIAN